MWRERGTGQAGHVHPDFASAPKLLKERAGFAPSGCIN